MTYSDDVLMKGNQGRGIGGGGRRKIPNFEDSNEG